MRYLLAVNRTIRGKLPKDATPAQWATFNDAFAPCELTSAEIAAEIRAGHAIAAVHDGRRKRANWRLCQHIGIDLDDGSLSWDDVVHMPLVSDYASIVHTTASHRPDAPRLRVLFLLADPITDPDTYASIVACFLRAFRTADPLCKDASRLFFGAPDCSLLHMPDNVLTEEDIANVATAWPPVDALDPEIFPERANGHATRPRAIGFRVPSDSDIVPPDVTSDAQKEFRATHLETLLDMVRTAPDGQKWSTLWRVSRALGGYARAGYLSMEEAGAALRGAIETRRPTVASMAAAYRTIEESLNHGALSPLYYTRGDNPRQAARAEEEARRHGLRARLIADRIDELERAILDAPDDAPNFADLLTEYEHLKTAA